MQDHGTARAFRLGRRVALGLAVLGLLAGAAAGGTGDAGEEQRVAESLAAFLRSARSVISSNQYLINDPSIADKGLTGDEVVRRAIATYTETTGTDPLKTDPASLEGELLRAQISSVKEVMDENQETINTTALGFKGFVPAVFARMVDERFMAKMGHRAEVKVTAPDVLVRNRKARPDEWEASVIDGRLLSPEWPEGQAFSEWTTKDGRDAFRFIAPEYYSEGCLICHGVPKGEMDITGYPKEGGALGDLGGAISITLYR
jgi:hypothetical protein